SPHFVSSVSSWLLLPSQSAAREASKKPPSSGGGEWWATDAAAWRRKSVGPITPFLAKGLERDRSRAGVRACPPRREAYRSGTAPDLHRTSPRYFSRATTARPRDHAV